MPTIAKGTMFGIVHDYLKIHLPKQRRLSQNTIRSYQNTLEQLFDFTKERFGLNLTDVTFEHLTSETMSAFLVHLEEVRHCKDITINQRLAAIAAFLRYATMIDISVSANLVELKKVPKKKLHATVVGYMSESSVSTILEQPNVKTTKGIRDQCMLILMYDTGARVHEIASIKICDLRLGKTPTITINGKRNKIRTVPITENTVNHLKQYLEIFHKSDISHGECPLFYSKIHGVINALSDRGLSKIVKKHGLSAKEQCSQMPDRVHPHLFRHSRAMHLYQHGMDLTLVSQWLGHANLETTLIYAHADTEQKRKAIQTATSENDPLHGKLDATRFSISDEDTLKRLYGLK